MLMGAQKIVFTASMDCKIRGFVFEENNTLKQVVEHPTPNTFVTKFLKSSDTFLICALASGKFLGWNLSSNSFDESAGHNT